MTKHPPFRYFKTSPLNPSQPLSGSLQAQQGLSVGLCWLWGTAGTPPLLTPQFQAKPSRCSRWVASIIERIDLGGASNPMLVLIKLTAATGELVRGPWSSSQGLAGSVQI